MLIVETGLDTITAVRSPWCNKNFFSKLGSPITTEFAVEKEDARLNILQGGHCQIRKSLFFYLLQNCFRWYAAIFVPVRLQQNGVKMDLLYAKTAF